MITKEYSVSEWVRSTSILTRTVFAGVIGLPLLALLVIGFIPREFEANVADTAWSRTVTREQRSLGHGEDWADYAPADSFNSNSCSMRQRGTHSCHPHLVPGRCSRYRDGKTTYYTCLKTEYDQCPTMRKWCHYDYWIWTPVDERVSQGETCHLGDGKRPIWPDLPEPWLVPAPDSRLVRVESYSVVFRAEASEYRLRPSSEEEYLRYCEHPFWVLSKAPLTGATPNRPR